MNRHLTRIAVFALILAFCFGLHWLAGTFRSEFGRYPDEGMHYVTGMMIHDWLVSGEWSAPMRFAERFYVHFPKVALGTWPPGFALLQTAWTFLWGDSRVAMLALMMTTAALLATLVFESARARCGTPAAAAAVVVLLAAGLTQQQTAMVMAEIPLALWSLLAMLLFARWLETDRWREILAFAFCAAAAILTKGNGWVIALAAPAALLLTGRARRLLGPKLWLAAAFLGSATVPFSLFSMRFNLQGWNMQSFPGWDYIARSFLVHAQFALDLLRLPATAIAALGLWDRLKKGPHAEPFWVTMAVYGVAIVVFHALVPTSIEPRKIYQVAPVICLFFAAGLDWAARAVFSRARLMAGAPRAAAALAGGLLFAVTAFSPLAAFEPGFAPAVECLLQRADRRDAAVLISSNPLLADSEAALIAEWASRERTAGTYLVRATKLLAIPSATGAGIDFAPAHATVEQLRDALAAVPIAYVILHTTPAPRSYRHHELLQRTLATYPADWERIYESRRGPDDLAIYRCRRNLQGIPVRLTVDLRNKIGRSLEGGDGVK